MCDVWRDPRDVNPTDIYLVIQARPSVGQAALRLIVSFSSYLVTSLGPLGGPRARSLLARCLVLVLVWASLPHLTSLSVTLRHHTVSLTLQSPELPRNHYNSPSGLDHALRCYTSQERTTQGR